VAMMTHSLVKKFWRSSGMVTPQVLYRQKCRVPQHGRRGTCECVPIADVKFKTHSWRKRSL
jgi:hypothetical protein